jgi:vesicle coat complex subunit
VFVIDTIVTFFSIIPKIENKKSNAEILKEIEKQRELLRLENIQIAKRRDALTKQEIYCEETTKRYEKFMNEFENRVNEKGGGRVKNLEN